VFQPTSLLTDLEDEQKHFTGTKKMKKKIIKNKLVSQEQYQNQLNYIIIFTYSLSNTWMHLLQHPGYNQHGLIV